MTELITLLIIFWFPGIIVFLKNFLTDLYYWEIKEYRWDRYLSSARWDQDSNHPNSLLNGFKFILFAALTLIFAFPYIAVPAIFITYVLWTYESFDFLQNLLNRKIRRPTTKSIRNLLILFLQFFAVFTIIGAFSMPFVQIINNTSLGGEFSQFVSERINENTKYSFTYPLIYILLGLSTLLGLFIDLASWPATVAAVSLTSPLAGLKRFFTIFRAKNKLSKLNPNLNIIGITGSQGKTTAKEILNSILQKDFKTLKTPENYNTAVGIADTITKQLDSTKEVFIAEMGAYKKREIYNITKAFKPHIAIITDIDTQHISLFGSQEKVAEAKAEILSHLNNSDIAILNGDNEFCRNLWKKNKGQTIYVCEDKESIKELAKINSNKVTIATISHLRNSKSNLEFEINYEGQTILYTFQHDYVHLANLIGLCIIAGHKTGLSLLEIQKILKTADLSLPRLTQDTGDNDTVILNDTYNSSRKGFIAGVNYMNKLKIKEKLKNRIVLTKGILELGKEKTKIYTQLANQLKDKIDILITSDHLLAKKFAENNKEIKIILAKKPEDMIYNYRKYSVPKDVVYLAGRLNPEVIQEIVSDKN